MATIGALTGLNAGWVFPLLNYNLQGWWVSTGGSVHASGWLCLLTVPFALRFFWAPLLERDVFPRLDKRRGWAFSAQLVVIFALVVIAGLEGWGINHPAATGFQLLCFLMLSFAGATLRSSLDAYMVDVSEHEEHGSMTWWNTLFYRLALLLMSGVAFWVAEVLGWTSMFLCAGLVMMALAYGVYHLPSVKDRVQTSLQPTTQLSWGTFIPQGAGKSWLIWLMVWMLSISLVGLLGTAFLLKGLGMQLSDVGLLNNMLGMFAGLLGGIVAPVALCRCRPTLWIALLLFMQGVIALMFVELSHHAGSVSLLVIATVICTRKFVSAALTATLVMVLMERCDPKHLASQYAFGCSFPYVFVSLLGPLAGAWVIHFGWTSWFNLTFFVSLLVAFVMPWSMLRTTLEAYQR